MVFALVGDCPNDVDDFHLEFLRKRGVVKQLSDLRQSGLCLPGEPAEARKRIESGRLGLVRIARDSDQPIEIRVGRRVDEQQRRQSGYQS